MDTTLVLGVGMWLHSHIGRQVAWIKIFYETSLSMTVQVFTFIYFWCQLCKWFCFFFCFTFRDLHLKMLQDWQLKETLIFIQFMLPLFLLLIQASHLKKYWRCHKSGKLIHYLTVLFNSLLEFYQLLITLQSGWPWEKHGCNHQQSSLQV